MSASSGERASSASRALQPGGAATPALRALRQDVADALRSLRHARVYAASVATALVVSAGVALPIFSLRASPRPRDAGLDPVSRLLAGLWPAGWGSTIETPAQYAGVLASRDLLRSFAGLAVAMACATVAVLVLSRAAARRREVAVRAALGGEPRRLLRHAELEAAFLALAAGALLAALALAVGLAMSASRPELLRAWLHFQPGIGPVAAGAGAGMLALLLFTPLAALPAASWRLARTLGSAHSTPPPSDGTLRQALAVAQLAAAVSLLIGAGLLLRGGQIRGAAAADALGDFAPAQATKVSFWSIQTPANPKLRAAYYAGLARRITGIHGVRAAGLASPGTWMGDGAEAPLMFTCPRCRVGPFGTPIVWAPARHQLVGPGFFAALGVRPVRGRLPTAASRTDTARVVVINRSFEALFQGVTDPIGQFVRIDATGSWYRIVAVVPDLRARGVGASLGVQPSVYLPLQRYPPLAADLFVRGEAPPDSAAQAAVAAALGASGAVRVERQGSLHAALARLAKPLDWLAGAALGVAAVVLILATHGVAAVALDDVRRRRRELAVRSALGAGPLSIARNVLGRAIRRVVAGAAWASGGAILVAWLLGRMSRSLPLFDAGIYAAALAIVAAVAVLASVAAVRAALRVELREALADE